MRIEQVCILEKKKKDREYKTPEEVFTSCPACKSSKVFALDGDVFCCSCSWNSVAIHAEVSADFMLAEMDEAIARSERQARRRPSLKRTTMKTSKDANTLPAVSSTDDSKVA